MKKKLRTLLIWIIVSSLFEVGLVALLNYKVQNMMGWTEPEKNKESIVTATIPSINIENIQISYDNSYIAYMEKGTLKIFNVKKDKVVFEKESQSTVDKTLGVLNYQWLPDRNVLVYFYAKNVKTVSETRVYSKKILDKYTQSETPNPSEARNDNTPSTIEEPQIIKKYIDKPIIEWYSLEFQNSDEETAPKETKNEFSGGSQDIPTGAKIDKIAVLPTTNMTYFTTSNAVNQKLLKITIMKKVSAIPNVENISEMVVSDLYDTVYVKSKVGSAQQILAIDNDSRAIITNNPDHIILGVRNGKVYIGEVKNDILTKIMTTKDLKTLSANPRLETVWQGSIPFNKDTKKHITANGQIIVYANQTANIITDGKLTEATLSGETNYISEKSKELNVVQLTKSDIATLVEIKPLK